jgi:two-component system sensor histidine kinase PilS (NtrC family)
MEIILRESDRLNKIITNFLTYARPRVSNFSEIDVREAISDTFTLLKHSPDVKENHVLEADLPEKPVMISADPTQLKQIFWNLARNSIQAMPTAETLKVKLRKLEKNASEFFEDTGCGMSPNRSNSFSSLFPIRRPAEPDFGLSIVYQIVRDHNGTINVRSRENEGTTITVELPTEIKISTKSEETSEGEMQPSRLERFLNVQ